MPDLRALHGIEVPMLVEAGLHACVCCPLLSGDRCYGGPNVAHERASHFDARHVDQLEVIAAWVASHLRSARQIEELSRRARTDCLTDTLNRLAFADIAEGLFERWRQGGGSFSLIALDPDRFKAINDRFGHAVGDAALVDVAGRMRARMRQADIPARMGGEEFAIALPGGDAEMVWRVADAIRRAIAEPPLRIGIRCVPLSVSAGIACPRDDDRDFHHALSRADDQLYQAKAAGRNRAAMEI